MRISVKKKRWNTIKQLLVIITIAIILFGCSSPLNNSESNSEVIKPEPTGNQVETIEDFMEKAENNEPAEITIEREYEDFIHNAEIYYKEYPDTPKGRIIYHLSYVYDESAQEGWINVRADVSQLDKPENALSSTLTDSQQCGYITKDLERRSYMLTECFHAWEYLLAPIVE